MLEDVSLNTLSLKVLINAITCNSCNDAVVINVRLAIYIAVKLPCLQLVAERDTLGIVSVRVRLLTREDSRRLGVIDPEEVELAHGATFLFESDRAETNNLDLHAGVLLVKIPNLLDLNLSNRSETVSIDLGGVMNLLLSSLGVYSDNRVNLSIVVVSLEETSADLIRSVLRLELVVVVRIEGG